MLEPSLILEKNIRSVLQICLNNRICEANKQKISIKNPKLSKIIFFRQIWREWDFFQHFQNIGIENKNVYLFQFIVDIFHLKKIPRNSTHSRYVLPEQYFDNNCWFRSSVVYTQGKHFLIHRFEYSNSCTTTSLFTHR